MESFYTDTSKMWSGLYRLAELNRLQQNFAYTDQAIVHQMLVVVMMVPTATVHSSHGPPTATANEIVGFCDVDARPLPADFKIPLPRPYLSDLCIAANYRRRGLAQALVGQAELFCRDILGRNTLWIRVQERNLAAMAMYQRLGYQIISKDIDTSSKKAFENKEMIITLRKDFQQ
jgi:ribosomal protein S18 acetylase RimI-like enzyme